MIPFTKAHSCGNDFLIVEERDAQANHAALARHLCARNTGIGADGVEFLHRREDGTLHLRLFNADGSEAELSGNGTRCVAAWLAYSQGLRDVTLGTLGGLRRCSILECSSEDDEEHFLIQTEMGIPFLRDTSIAIESIGNVEGVVVDVGNPHFVLFTEDVDFAVHGLPWQELGARICTHPAFPQGTNAEFVRVLAPDRIEFRIFERGVGPTTSSGTGTCASAAAAIARRACSRALTATSIGGAQQIEWPVNDAPMLLTGPADIICTGRAAVPSPEGLKA